MSSPSHRWIKVTLGDVTVNDGVKRGPWGGAIKKAFFVETGYKVYEQSNVIRNDFSRGSYFVSEEKYDELKGFSVEHGDVLVTAAGTIGRVAVVPDDASPGIFNQALIRLRPDLKKVHLPFFVAHLRRMFGQAEQDKLTQGSALQNLMAIGTLRDLPFDLPPLSEQRRIADILDKSDVIRRKRKQAIDLTEELLRSAFLEMVGPQAGGYSGWPEATFESLAAPAPGTMRTGPFGSDLRHSEFVDEGVAVLGIDNAVRNSFAWDERRYITPEKYERLKRYTVRPRDVIVTIMGTTGRSAVVPKDIPLAITSKHLATITLNKALVEPEFVAQAIHRHPAVLAQIQQANRGAIMSGLNLGLIKSLMVRLPPLQTQRRFAAITMQVRTLASRLENARMGAEELFDSLIQRAFRGELTNSSPQPSRGKLRS
jgi:type I restriction enzyme S subunit